MLQNLLIAEARATASTILGAVKSLVLQLEDLLGGTADQQPAFSALGVVARPTAPVSKDDATASNGVLVEGACEVLAIKTDDGLQPFAYRDLRIHQRCPPPNEGDVFMAGYQGGYVSIRAATGNLGSVVRVHAPRLNGSTGEETLAHSLVLDPSSSAAPAIALTHGSGYSIRILNNGTTEVRDKLVVAPDSSPQQVVLATDLNTWVSQVNAYLGALASAITGLGGTVGGSPPSAVPASSSKLLAAP